MERTIPGISRQEEELQLKRVIDIAQRKLEATQSDVKALAEELHTMLDEFDESDKEAQAMWHNTDARFKHVNQELNRATQARKKPYFGRIDFTDSELKKPECYYIGHSVIALDPAHPEVIDWRAPIASVYYDSSLGDVTYSVKGEGKFEINLSRKRTYEIKDDALIDFYDSDVVANDDLLTKYLAKNKRAVLGEIIATIQKEQNEAIRKKPQHNMIVQGAAGSGKTTVAMHRISYILYNYEEEFAPEDFYIIGSNRVLLNYITGVLPQLNVYGVSQMTMEQLFVRLLYEEWNPKFQIVPVKMGETPPEKGTLYWFEDLREYLDKYERSLLPLGDVVIEKNGKVLLTADKIEKLLCDYSYLSRAQKIEKLTEHLMAKFENEISGRYYSYSQEEKKKLTTYYEAYFGKPEWKGSIFDLYTGFYASQGLKYTLPPLEENTFDVYDLAALAYIYKRIKETEIIREAGHVVIDEAQDFGMMIYSSLKYCLTKCTYTIMGDVSQNISSDYGLNSWEELTSLMLPGEFDTFMLLQKSYRNTIEISGFATDILHHGTFPVYPIQPIIRHGDDVEVEQCSDFKAAVRKTIDTVKKWQRQGKETIAVICGDENEATRVKRAMEGKIRLARSGSEGDEFQTGVMILSLTYTKGLEFDGVIIFDAGVEKYPLNDCYVKRLYVAATRALHNLMVLHTGELTDIIKKPVTEEMRNREIKEVKRSARPAMLEEPEETKKEFYQRVAKEGTVEMDERLTIGPRRIRVQQAKPVEEEKRRRVKISGDTTSIPSYLERRKKELERPETKMDTGEYGEMPDNNALHPPGHGRIDCAVRMVMKGKGYVDMVSGYGILRITPMDRNLIRITFGKTQKDLDIPADPEMTQKNFPYKYRETKDAVELLTEKVLVKVVKKTGNVNFYTPTGKLLLSEREKEPRQLTGGNAWMFFAWDKKESLIARGVTDNGFMRMNNKAKYISFVGKLPQMPALLSDKGYEIYLPSGKKTLCCNIGMYGNYLSLENSEVADYYVKVK